MLYQWEWEAGRSTCKVLEIGTRHLHKPTVASIIRAAASLREVSVRGCSSEVVHALLSSASSLKQISLGTNNARRIEIQAFPCVNLTRFECLTPLAILALCLIDLETFAMSTGDRGSEFGCTDWIDFTEAFPPSLESLILRGHRKCALFSHELPDLTQQLLAMVEGKRAGTYRNLNEICVHPLRHKPIDYESYEFWDDGEDESPYFGGEELSEQCNMSGVMLHENQPNWSSGTNKELSKKCSGRFKQDKQLIMEPERIPPPRRKPPPPRSFLSEL